MKGNTSDMADTDWELFAVDLQRLLSNVQQVEVYPTGRGIHLFNSGALLMLSKGMGSFGKNVMDKVMFHY